jgi:hypothetical protein
VHHTINLTDQPAACAWFFLRPCFPARSGTFLFSFSLSFSSPSPTGEAGRVSPDFDASTDPAGGRQTITYVTCNSAKNGSVFSISATGLATSASKRTARMASSAAGWTKEYVRASCVGMMFTGGVEGFIAGGGTGAVEAALAARWGVGGVEVMVRALMGAGAPL